MSNNEVFNLDANKCSKDGLCTDICPMGLLEINRGKSFPKMREGKGDECIRCGHCLSVCPHGAISIDGLDSNNCPKINNDWKLGFEQVSQLLRQRRSIRQYSNKKVEKDVITKLLNLASTSPTAGNSQQVKWMVVNSSEEILKISGMVIDLFKNMIETQHPMSKIYSLTGIIDIFEKQGWTKDFG